jgi:replication factor C large subunit
MSMLSEKVRPSRIAAMIGNEQARLDLIKWLKNWRMGSKALLLTGPPGVGKSTSVYAVAREFGYTVIEYNASDIRTKSNLSSHLSGALENASLFGEEEKLMIFLDEVDGLSGRADYAGIEFIIEFTETASMPVAMAANVEDDPKLRKLEQKSQLIRFSSINEDLIFIYLKSIARKEEIPISNDTLERIALSCRGDVRYALNLFQTVIEDQTGTLFQTDRQFYSDAAALDSVFLSSSLEEAIARLRQYDASPFEKVRSVFDSVVSAKNLSVEQRAESLNLLSDADILLQQINKNQRWRLLRYMDRYLGLAVLGRSIKRSDSSIPWNLKISIWNDGRVTKEFLSELPSEFHVGKGAFASLYLPYFALYLKNRPDDMARFVEKHEFSDSDKRVLLKIAAKN